MAAIDRLTSHIRSLLAPRLHHVIGLANDALRSPERQQRNTDKPSGVKRIVLQVDIGGGTIVLAGPLAHGRVAIATAIFLHDPGLYRTVCLHLMREVRLEKVIGISSDHPLRKIERLNKEEPPEIACSEGHVGACIHGRRGRDVEDRDPLEYVRVVKRHAMEHPSSAIMPDGRKALVAEPAHHLDLVRRHRPLGIVHMAIAALGLYTVTVAAQVRRNDAEPLRELRRDLVPGDVRLRMTVQQKQRWPGAGERDTDSDAVLLDVPLLEAGNEICRHRSMCPAMALPASSVVACPPRSLVRGRA